MGVWSLDWQWDEDNLAELARHSPKRDGWVVIRRESSHRVLRKGSRQRVFAFHEKMDLGQIQMKQVTSEFGYAVDELRKL